MNKVWIDMIYFIHIVERKVILSLANKINIINYATLIIVYVLI